MALTRSTYRKNARLLESEPVRIVRVLIPKVPGRVKEVGIALNVPGRTFVRWIRRPEVCIRTHRRWHIFRCNSVEALCERRKFEILRLELAAVSVRLILVCL